jgi:hypothetical protein
MLARQDPSRHGEKIYHEGAKATKVLVSVIASEAKQSREIASLDCFVVEPVLGPAFGRTRGLLAMTRPFLRPFVSSW